MNAGTFTRPFWSYLEPEKKLCFSLEPRACCFGQDSATWHQSADWQAEEHCTETRSATANCCSLLAGACNSSACWTGDTHLLFAGGGRSLSLLEAGGQPDRSAQEEGLGGELGLCTERITFCGGAVCSGVREWKQFGRHQNLQNSRKKEEELVFTAIRPGGNEYSAIHGWAKMPEVGMGERAGMRSCSFGRETRGQAQQEDPWALPRCHRQERNGSHVCKAASCSEAVGKQDRVCRGNSKGWREWRREQVRSWLGTKLRGALCLALKLGCNALRWLSPSTARCTLSVNFGNPAEKKHKFHWGTELNWLPEGSDKWSETGDHSSAQLHLGAQSNGSLLCAAHEERSQHLLQALHGQLTLVEGRHHRLQWQTAAVTFIHAVCVSEPGLNSPSQKKSHPKSYYPTLLGQPAFLPGEEGKRQSAGATECTSSHVPQHRKLALLRLSWAWRGKACASRTPTA